MCSSNPSSVAIISSKSLVFGPWYVLRIESQLYSPVQNSSYMYDSVSRGSSFRVDLLSSACPPPSKRKQSNCCRNRNSIIHIRSGNRPDSWEKEDNANEEDPHNSNTIQWLLQLP